MATDFCTCVKYDIIEDHALGRKRSIAQVSSSFKWLDTRTSTSTTPTLITEALRRVTSLQLF